MTRSLSTLLPLLVAALVLAASSATAADDPAKALDGLLKPDPASPLGGTLTGLQYTGFGLSHVKKADIPKFDPAMIPQGGEAVVKQAMKVGPGLAPAVTSDLAAQGSGAAGQFGKAKDSVKPPSPEALNNAVKSAGKGVHVPGGSLDQVLKRAGGPKIDGMDIVNFGGEQPDPKQAAEMVGTVGKTAAGLALKPYLDTIKTGVTAGGAVIDGADGAVGAAKQAAAASQKGKKPDAPAAADTPAQQKRWTTPALALFPGTGPEAVELGNQLKNTLGLPTPDQPESKTVKGAGQKRFHQKRAGRRHP